MIKIKDIGIERTNRLDPLKQGNKSNQKKMFVYLLYLKNVNVSNKEKPLKVIIKKRGFHGTLTVKEMANCLEYLKQLFIAL
jgi:hypothetical protein